jgi:AraC-like DNA-binding protein
MYISGVNVGDTPARPWEDALRQVQVQVALSRRLKIDTSWRYDLQSPFWRLYVVDKPGAFVTYAGNKLALHSGRIHLIPAWVRFQSLAMRAMTQNYMHFYVTGFPSTLLRQLFNHPLLLDREPVLDGLYRRWRDGLNASSGFTELGWASSLAYAAVATAAAKLPEADQRVFSNSWQDFSPIGPALECIDRRLSRPPANPELARLCHLSTDRFIRKFHVIVGMTPARYGLERRVALAAQSLTATSRTIEEIADASGFTDRFHFSRAFKARLGLAPVAYRRLHRIAAHES